MTKVEPFLPLPSFSGPRLSSVVVGAGRGFDLDLDLAFGFPSGVFVTLNFFFPFAKVYENLSPPFSRCLAYSKTSSSKSTLR